jgi:hypothetical protein
MEIVIRIGKWNRDVIFIIAPKGVFSYFMKNRIMLLKSIILIWVDAKLYLLLLLVIVNSSSEWSEIAVSIFLITPYLNKLDTLILIEVKRKLDKT